MVSLSFEVIINEYVILWVVALIIAETIDYFIRRYGEALPRVYAEYSALRLYRSFFEARSSALFNYSKEKLNSLVSQYTDHLRTFLSDWVWVTSFRATRLVLIVIILYQQNPYVLLINALYVLSFLFLALQISSRFSIIAKKHSEQTLESRSSINNFILQLNVLKRLQAGRLFSRISEQNLWRNWEVIDQLQRFHAWRWYLQLTLFNALYAATLVYGIYQVKQGELELGFLLLIKWSFDELWFILVYVIEYYVSLVQQRQDTLLVRREFSAILPLATAIDSGGTELQELFKGLSLSSVSATLCDHQGSERLFEIDSFTLSAGERIGIIGESGAGKSTLLSILLQMHPLRGDYLINNKRDISVAKSPELFSLINSQDALFKVSLRDNITLGEPIEEDRLNQVIKGCLIDEFAPDLDVEIGSTNFNLSTGQEQRIRLARGIIRERQIYLLDEPFNGLDQQKREVIIAFLTEFLATKTVVLVTHNTEELKFVEKVYPIEQILKVV
jgi:ATP-binding cassette subfamily B protein